MIDRDEDLIRALSEAGESYLNGAEIARRLGCTRSAVWKKMKRLRGDGYPIEAVPNRGYRLASEKDRFLAEFERSFSGEEYNNGGFTVHVAEVAESTNRSAREAAEKGAADREVFVALFQSGGKGRRGRTWISAPGEGLCFSVLIRPDISSELTGMLSLMFGLCVFCAIGEIYSRIKIGIKWPNDIISLMNGRKLCGILAETSFEDNRLSFAVIGCGVNVSQVSFPEPIRETATSLIAEGVPDPSSPVLLASILRHYSQMYASFRTDPTGFLAEYRKNCVTLGREVRVVGAEDRIGNALDINDRGELIVRYQDGSVAAVSAGEVSVRGVAGYVSFK